MRLSPLKLSGRDKARRYYLQYRESTHEKQRTGDDHLQQRETSRTTREIGSLMQANFHFLMNFCLSLSISGTAVATSSAIIRASPSPLPRTMWNSSHVPFS